MGTDCKERYFADVLVAAVEVQGFERVQQNVEIELVADPNLNGNVVRDLQLAMATRENN